MDKHQISFEPHLKLAANNSNLNMVQVRFRKLFIGGIHPNITERDLKVYFGQFGPIASCTIHRDRDTGRSRGFGFITFDDPASVDEVQESRPHTIKGCEVTLKRAVPKELFHECDGLLTVNRIFVGGLKQTVEESDLRQYFGSYGTVRKIDVMMDRYTNVKRGFAFIEFDDYDPVDKVVMQGKHNIGGQDVTVKKAKSRLEMELIKQCSFPKDVFPNLMRRRSIPFDVPTPFGPHFGAAYNRTSFDNLEYDCPFHHNTRRRRYF